MPDDKQPPQHPNYLSFADDDDEGSDATVELSIRDVFQFKNQDARAQSPATSSKPAASSAPASSAPASSAPASSAPASSGSLLKTGSGPVSALSAAQAQAQAQAQARAQTPLSGQPRAAQPRAMPVVEIDVDLSVATMQEGVMDLQDLELIPLEDDEPQDSTMQLSVDRIPGRERPTSWERPRPQERASQTPTRPALSALQVPEPDATSVFEIPDTLLDQVREQSAPTRPAALAAGLVGANAQAPGRAQPKPRAWPAVEADTTRAITLDELREAEALARQDDDDASQTTELSAYTEPEEDPSAQLLEFVAAVDENLRLFVPRSLFEQGKLKPGMRLLIQAKIMP